jgi:carbohydrate-binding DOMON domain-containing protein
MRKTVVVLIAIVTLAFTAMAANTPLTDQQLDTITAGAVTITLTQTQTPTVTATNTQTATQTTTSTCTSGVCNNGGNHNGNAGFAAAVVLQAQQQGVVAVHHR